MSLLSLLIGYFDFLSQGISSFKKSYVLYSMWYRKGKDVTCSQVWCPILGIFALHLTHPSAHTAVRSEQTQTHTPWTHTRSSGQPMQWRPGSSWGFSALLKGLTSVVVLKVERALDIHSPHRQFLLDLRLEPATFGLQVRLSIHYATTSHVKLYCI